MVIKTRNILNLFIHKTYLLNIYNYTLQTLVNMARFNTEQILYQIMSQIDPYFLFCLRVILYLVNATRGKMKYRGNPNRLLSTRVFTAGAAARSH